MKDSIQKYGWIVVTCVVLAILIALATPFSMAVKNAIVGTVNKMDEIRQSGEDYTFPYTVKLKTNIPDAGTVTFTGDYSGTSVDLRGNKTLTFKATKNSGYVFVGWYAGDTLISSDMEYTTGYSVNSNVTITAKYEEKMEAGLYQTGTKTMLMSWDELVSGGILSSTGKIVSGQEANLAGDLVVSDTLTGIPGNAYYNCTALTSVIIPDGIKSIHYNAFDGCENLTNITISANVNNIGPGAFQRCTNLKTVYYNGNLEQWCNMSFGMNANPCFNGAELYIGGIKQTDITIPNTITKINQYAFYGCTSLTSVTIPDSVTSIGEQVFYQCKSLTSVAIPDSVTTIGEGAFIGCTSLTSMEIPDSVTKISNNTFYGCTNLTSVTIPDDVTYIGSYAFNGCTSLTSVTIPDDVTYIGSYAFNGCTSLTSVTIPDSVTSIGSHAFRGCTNLKTVYYEGTLEQWCQISFSNSAANPCYNGVELYIDNVKQTNIVIPNTITEIKDSTFCGCTNLTSVTIPDGVTSIGEDAFYNCTSLTSVTIPDSVTAISKQAFPDCKNLKTVYYEGTLEQWCQISFSNSSANPCYNGAGLYIGGVKQTDITIPNSITEIKDYTFSGCTSLTSVTIPDSVTSIGRYAFYKCTSLTGVDISDVVPSIGEGTFNGCTSLTSVTIPDSVTSIGSHAFYECTSLTDITFTGTVAQWQAISFGTHWKYNIGTDTITCTDGTIAKDGTVTPLS